MTNVLVVARRYGSERQECGKGRKRGEKGGEHLKGRREKGRNLKLKHFAALHGALDNFPKHHL
jgi:hypothetical protein